MKEVKDSRRGRERGRERKADKVRRDSERGEGVEEEGEEGQRERLMKV